MKHLSDEQLVGRLYGVADRAVHEHLGACAECLERYEVAERRRALLTGFKPLSPARMARQRTAIVARIESRGPILTGALPNWIWAPAAAALVIGAGLYFSKPPVPPAADPAPAAADTIDAGWYEEVYTHFDLMEPRAASPIRELFQEEAPSE